MRSITTKSSMACLVIFAVVMAWFSPWWAAGRVMAPLDLQNTMMSPWRQAHEGEYAKNHIVSDSVSQYLVYRLVAERDFQREGRIGWSSLTYGGTAQYANTMALYDDWTMQLHRWFDFWTAWHLGLMGQVLLAAYGMYLFLRGRSIGILWAACGALAYAANSQFVTWVFHRWALSSFCWVPWILWAIDGYRCGKRGFWAAVPVFIAMAFLGGTLQHSALVVLAVMAMWIDEALKQRSRTKTVAATGTKWRWPEAICDRRNSSNENTSDGHSPQQNQTWLLARYAAWGLLGAGLAGMMLLPCVAAFLESNRLGLHMGMNVNAQSSIYPIGPLQPLMNLAAYPLQILPSILGRCDSVDVLKLFKSELFYVCYFGSLPVLIAYLCLFRRDSPTLARLLGAAGLLLPLTPLVRYLYQRLFLLFIIGGILGFVHFMQNTSRDTRLRILRVSAIVGGLAVAAWTAVSIALLIMPQFITSLRDKIAGQGGGSSFGYFSDWLQLRAGRFVADLFIWSPQQLSFLALMAAGLLGLRWTASTSSSLRQRGALLVAMVVCAEVSWFAARWVVWSDPVKHPLFAETAESKALREEVGSDGRVSALFHPVAHMAVTPFITNTLSVYDIATISGYDSIIPDGMILPKESIADARRLGPLAVSHLITWTGNPDVPAEWREVWRSPMMTLYQNPLAVPRYAGFTNDGEMEAFFGGSTGDMIRLEESSGLQNRRLIELPEGVRWIRIAENQAPGWEFRSAGENPTSWLPVARAEDASMLMRNPHPERNSRIEMRYAPPLRKTGWMITLASLLALILGQAWICVKRNKGTQPALS
jgi:hypothetical protein